LNVYVDSSALLRVVLGESGALATWSSITRPVASELIRVECLRTVDRARVRLALDDEEVARLRSELLEAIERFTLVQLDSSVLARASDPFPTLVGTLDAIHLASADLARHHIDGLAFATHDHELGVAARAIGFEVMT
jgi:predicted nucleic acid-binding protein